MSIFSNILFPVDFSGQCAQTACSVAAVARQFKSKVTLIHAIGDYEGFYTPDAPSPDAWIAWLRKTARARLQSFGAPCLDEFIVARRVEDGDPSDVITRYASDHEIDLIMMSTHGIGIFRRYLLGSVTAKVLHDCPTPVWTTVHTPSAGLEPKPIRNVVCATDLSEPSRCVVRMAVRIARDCGASLHLVHAIPMPMPMALAVGGPECYSPETVHAIEDAARAGLEGVQKETGVVIDSHAEPGFVLPVVSNAIAEHHADLLVIGRGQLQQTFGALHSDVGALIGTSACPVVSV